jgi:membrane-associated phospholipid phosphatase
MAPREEEHELLWNGRLDFFAAIALSAATALLFLLVALPSTKPPVQRMDDAFLRVMVSHRNGLLTALARILNIMGAVTVILPVRLLVAGFMALKRRWWHLAAFVLTVVLSEATISLLKGLYDRVRPVGSLVHTSGASFPSGHAVATSTTAVAIVIALFPRGPHRWLWGAVAAGVAFVMTLSRAYLAAHWLSDAIAGTLLGTSVALDSALLVQWIRERHFARSRVASAPP